MIQKIKDNVIRPDMTPWRGHFSMSRTDSPEMHTCFRITEKCSFSEDCSHSEKKKKKKKEYKINLMMKVNSKIKERRVPSMRHSIC